MTEEWRPVPGWTGYEASTLGRIRSVDRIVSTSHGLHRRYRGCLLRQKTIKRGGYRAVTVSGRTQRVHVLVLLAHAGPRPDGMEGCHADGDPTNNRLENLSWDTHLANVHDTIRMGRHPELAKTACPRRHALAAPNLVAHAARNGWRDCLACARARSRCRAAARRGDLLDFRAEADRAYRRILTQAVA